MNNKGKLIITMCADCERETNQHILFSRRIKRPNVFDRDQLEHFEFMTLQCAGCSMLSFLRREFIEDPENDGKIIFIDNNYPGYEHEFEEFNFLRDEDQDQLPAVLNDLYEEIRDAFEKESKVLAGIGLRTMVEAVCLQQNISGRNLQDKIKNLQVAGLISSAEQPILDKLRLIGNSATHQIKALPINKLGYALEIVNHVLISIYILPKINKKLKLT